MSGGRGAWDTFCAYRDTAVHRGWVRGWAGLLAVRWTGYGGGWVLVCAYKISPAGVAVIVPQEFPLYKHTSICCGCKSRLC